jgi:hypothetical protein
MFDAPRGTGSVKLSPVYQNKPGVSGNACEENRLFWEATPSGEITMHINNPAGFKPFADAFHKRIPFYVDFTEAPE